MIVCGAKIIFIVSVALQNFFNKILSTAKSLPLPSVLSSTTLKVAVVLVPLYHLYLNVCQLQL